MNKRYLNGALITWRGSVADPAHLIDFYIKANKDIDKLFFEEVHGVYTQSEYIGIAAPTLIKWTIRFLGWRIEKYLNKCDKNKKGIQLV